jgi:GTP cyclohydrolase I
MQIQERLTDQIKICIQDALDRLVGCCNRSAAHVYEMRGIQKQNSVTTTSSFTGLLKDKTKGNLLVLFRIELTLFY